MDMNFIPIIVIIISHPYQPQSLIIIIISPIIINHNHRPSSSIHHYRPQSLSSSVHHYQPQSSLSTIHHHHHYHSLRYHHYSHHYLSPFFVLITHLHPHGQHYSFIYHHVRYRPMFITSIIVNILVLCVIILSSSFLLLSFRWLTRFVSGDAKMSSIACGHRG